MRGRVIICGGSGFIGKALAEELRSVGYEVIVVSRHPNADEVSWDHLVEVLNGAKAVINLAGRSIACKFSEENKREILHSRLESAKLVAGAIEQCLVKPEKWINSSATGYYGDRGEDELSEYSFPGTEFTSEVCIQWEDACLLCPVSVDKIVVRTGVVLGDEGGVLKTLIPLTKAFAGGTAGRGDQWLSWIHLDDVVGIYRWVIEHDTPAIMSGSTPNPVRNRDFMAWLRRIHNRPWTPSIPAFMITLVGNLVGPDGSLVLDSCKVIPTQPEGYAFKYPDLASIERADL